MQLSLSELRRRPGRAETLISKIKNKTPFDISNGSMVTFDRIAFTDSGRVIEFVPSKDQRQIQGALEWLKSKATNDKYILLINDKQRFALSDIVKTGDFGGQGGKSAKGSSKGSRADVMEAVFAAAIFARFINGPDLVVEQDVIGVLDSLKDNKMKQIITRNIKNTNRKVNDTVTLKIYGSLACVQCLTDKNIQFILADIIQKATKYANQATAISWAKLLYENNRRNNVEVIAVGLGDQKGTDPNVFVRVDRKLINIEIPLTHDAIKNNGRVIGASFDELVDVFNNTLGIDISKYQSKFFKAREQSGVRGSTIFAYKAVASEYNKIVKNNRSKTYHNLSVGMNYTMNKKTTAVVVASTFTRSESQLFKFDNLSKLYTTETKAVISYEKNLPILNIVDSKNKTLLKLQAKNDMKVNGSYMNHYISKGQILVELGKYITT